MPQWKKLAVDMTKASSAPLLQDRACNDPKSHWFRPAGSNARKAKSASGTTKDYECAAKAVDPYCIGQGRIETP